MIKKKVCLLGSFAVGKTSLFEKYVYSIFSEKYLTTVGVKIDKKSLDIDGVETTLILWDIEGRSNFSRLRGSYLKGMDGYLLVADGTRERTLAEALDIREKVDQDSPGIPFVLLLNKSDLEKDWILPYEREIELRNEGITVLRTSAKMGLNVEEAFLALGRLMLAR
jgi:small GTP-binding protein